MKRTMVERPAGVSDSGIGPTAQVQAHVALLPLVRVGAYLGHDISPLGTRSARDITWGGLRAKVMSPWPRGSLRAWMFVGFGYAGVYARSSSTEVTLPGLGGAPPTRSSAVIHGATGSFYDLPFGIGASYKLRKPWELCAELGAHVGLGHSGSAYDAPGPRVTSDGVVTGNAAPAGKDRFAIGLTVGVLLDL